MSYDFATPEGRLAAVEALGPQRYNEELLTHQKRSVIKMVAGHDLRPVFTGFGRLIAVGSTGRAFSTLEQAEAFAEENPDWDNHEEPDHRDRALDSQGFSL